MKINFQKIFSIVFSVCVISCFPLSVSATDINGGMTSGGGGSGGNRTDFGNACEVYLQNLYDFCNGDITYEEWADIASTIMSDESGVLVDKLGLKFMQETTEKVADIVLDYGLNAPTYIYQWLDDYFDDYRDLAQVESSANPDKKGYGAMAVGFNINNQINQYFYYADYINVAANLKNFFPHSESGTFFSDFYDRNGNYERTTTYSSGKNIIMSSSFEWYFYGDVRYEDGSKYPTNEEYVEEEVLNFDNASDDELEKLLQDLMNKLNLEMPDLSSVEGLLTSIYNRLGTLDSDNDNELLSQVLVAIQSLQGTDNSELLAVLNEIKEELTNGTTGDNSDLAEKLELMITVDDFIIDEEAYKNHSEVLKLRLQEKFVFADDLKNLVVYTLDKYANSSENPHLELQYNSKTYSVDLNAYNEYIPTIRFMIAAFTYISFALHTYRKIPSYINGGDNL